MQQGQHTSGHPGRFRPLRFVACVLAGLVGCAYSFQSSNLPGHIRSVAIVNLANSTLEPGIEQEATAAIVDQFIKDGRLKLAPEGQADARLSGSLVKYENRVYNYGADRNPRDYIVVVTADVEMKDQVKNRELWRDEALTRTAVYVPGGASGLTTEREARDDAVRALAADIVTRTLEQW
jgi:hypothetical protein